MQNFRIEGITDLTAFIGPNGAGKSTLLDVFVFLSECFSSGLPNACEKRGDLGELRTRGREGPVIFELKYREGDCMPTTTYHLAIDEDRKGPYVHKEFLEWWPESTEESCRFLDFKKGGEIPAIHDSSAEEKFDTKDILAANVFGQFAKSPDKFVAAICQ